MQQAASYWQGLHDSVAYAMFREPRDGRPDPWAVVSMIEWGRAVRLATGLAGSNAAAVIPPSVAAEDKAAWIELVKRAKRIERITYTRGATSTALLAGRKRDERLVIKRQMKELAQRMAGDVARARVERTASGDASLAAFLGGETRKRIAAAAADTMLCYLVQPPVSSGDDEVSLPGLAVLVEPRPTADDEEPNIKVVELREMHGAAVTEWTQRWREHTEAARVRDMALARPDGPGLGALAVDELLGDLGSSVLQPILDTAGHPDRLVLLPDAVLGLLPWHAALVTQAGGTIPRPACLSTVISYAPSAEVLNLCRQAVRRSGGGLGGGSAVFPREFLGVAAPKHHLPEAEPEVVTCARHFEHAVVLSEVGVRPTLARVLRALDEPPRGSRVVHFACHGLVDNLNPRYSSLILDAPEPGDDAALLNGFTVDLDLAAAVIDKLTIADLWSAELAGTRLAVLSACRSGDAADDLPGEFTSLAAGFVAGGVPGVVSTLARVDDLAARLVACRFYYEWRVRPGDPAAALAAAQSWLALGSPDEVAWWAKRYADWQDGDADKVRHMNHAAAWAPFCFTGA